VLDNAFRYDGGDALETGRRVLGCGG